jgi:hypothetical protein
LRDGRILIRSEPREHFGSIEARHVKIEQEERRNFRSKLFQRLNSAGGFPTGITGPIQRSRKHVSARSVVVDYQDDALVALHFLFIRKGVSAHLHLLSENGLAPSIRCKYSLSLATE